MRSGSGVGLAPGDRRFDPSRCAVECDLAQVVHTYFPPNKFGTAPCILAVSSLSNSTARNARLDALDTSNTSCRVETWRAESSGIWSCLGLFGLSPSAAPLAATLDDAGGLMTPSRCWYRRRDVPHSETVLPLWQPPEPGMHCRPTSDLNRRSAFSGVIWRLTCFMSHFWNNLTKLITAILIWRFTHFYCILYCFYIFVQWSCSNLCDRAIINTYFCNNNNHKSCVVHRRRGGFFAWWRIRSNIRIGCWVRCSGEAISEIHLAAFGRQRRHLVLGTHHVGILLSSLRRRERLLWALHVCAWYEHADTHAHWSPNSTCLVTSRLDTTRSTCRAHTFWLCLACRTAWLDALVSTRLTSRTCRVVSRRDFTSQVEFELYRFAQSLKTYLFGRCETPVQLSPYLLTSVIRSSSFFAEWTPPPSPPPEL